MKDGSRQVHEYSLVDWSKKVKWFAQISDSLFGTIMSDGIAGCDGDWEGKRRIF
ncbi:hypothetical protein FD47_GL001158 [Lentilactobacillus parafarraginis DSM 18390 = JCM 14109]|jgi:hypothetical protein|uniref:Uncharacterized protein n=1 Tax=Lentilactobacillus parafarraginis DSM 18390 = JCM 14109 TaxID=1423786 RepID=A0A0R1YP36_9LACO|nr:hypothetical protein FD47_GL001158 [Lentilactobacillus parafarraginis DSM 18390 = JCM 14109]